MPGKTRVQLTYTSRMVEAAFSSVQAGSSATLMETLEQMGETASDGSIQAYLVTSFMAVARALLRQTGDYPLPSKKEPTSDGDAQS